MFEIMTYDRIMERMLARIPDDMDKREGSVIWDALSPAALELELCYIALEYAMNQTFADTQEREYLIRRCAERGITPYPATGAILKGVFTPANVDVVGKRFNLDKLNYVVVKAIEGESGAYQVQCETPGIEGGQHFGTLVPIEYIDGLESATATELLIPGEDEEETEALRERYFSTFIDKPYGGNVQDYILKTNGIEGVGATKVTPIWNGPGTVKLTILNSDFDKASNTLIAGVQEEIDPTQDGKGSGVAPIGHIVTVDTVNERIISLNCVIELETGYTVSGLQTAIDTAIQEYLLSLRKEWAKSTRIIVRAAQIEAQLLNIPGILDIHTLTYVGETAEKNLILEDNEIPVFGSIGVTEYVAES